MTDVTPEVQLLPPDLIAAFQSNTLIPVVGAGASMSIKDIDGERLFPSWRGLLKSAAKRVEPTTAAIITSLIAGKQYQLAADFARTGLKGALWSEFFTEHFNISADRINTDTLALPKAIWTLSNRVITLNYDKMLRQGCPDANCSDFDNTSESELATFIRRKNKTPALWHLHGKIDNVKDVIFTSESYDKLYETNRDTATQYKAALDSLKQLCTSSRLLFIGCSLDDAELLQQLASQNELFAGNTGPHYALVKQDQKEAIAAKIKDIDNLQLITFADFGQPLLDTLKAITASAPTPIGEKRAAHVTTLSATKIAILSAKPIDKHYDYKLPLEIFKGLECTVDYYALSVSNLNDLDGYDYVFILSKWVKGRVVIEQDNLSSTRVTLAEIEQNICDSQLAALFIFLDKAIDPALSSDLIKPTMILPELNRTELKAFCFQLFKGHNFAVFKQAVFANSDNFHAIERVGNKNHNQRKTLLPEEIDPKTVNNYVGRQTDLEVIIQKVLAQAEGDGILTIKGSGGIGKTTTVKKIAVELATRNYFRDGIDFVDCEFITDFRQFEYNVTKLFGLELAIDIKEHIRQNDMSFDALLILDNFETLLHIDDKNKINDFVQFICDHCTVVITTREVLDLDFEEVYELRNFTTDEAEDLFIQESPFDKLTAKDRILLRQDILENLLGNNPLAIKLITKNIIKGKKLSDLEMELKTDFFGKTTGIDLDPFDGYADVNIQRIDSVYACINYSYCQLSDKEKLVFELLALFHDGINLEDLKHIADDVKHAQRRGENRQQEMFTTERVILALEHKSLLENNNGMMRLQSIIGKFADQQLQKKPDVTSYYQKVFDYNNAVINKLSDLESKNGPASYRKYNQQQNNFLKCMKNINSYQRGNTSQIEFLHHCSRFASLINAEDKMLKAISDKKSTFADIPSVALLFELIVICLRYFKGEFDAALSDLIYTAPLELIHSLNPEQIVENLISISMSDAYTLEGEALICAINQQKNRKRITFSSYPFSLFLVGEYRDELNDLLPLDSFELTMSLNTLNLEVAQIEQYLSTLYEKNHIEIAQSYYLKSKMVRVNKKTIQKLVSVNPFTAGLKILMFAFIEVDQLKADELYNNALTNLKHIKYYYVEGLLYYSRFLQQTDDITAFETIHAQGAALAKKHYYRYLTYQFEDLLEPKSKPYDRADYPLPDGINFDVWVNYLVKERS